MAPRVDPIMLYGFCFHIQSKQTFNQQWACAFHTSWYTDERHPMWDAIEDPNKRREIRYGNNIAVLFHALLHLRKFYGQESLWTAVARGFNTSASFVRNTAEILTHARRAQRDKPSKDVSDTARAADDWIDFLDSRPTHLHSRVLSDPEVFKAAEAFFDTQEKRQLNAARVPTNSRQPLHINTSRLTPRGSFDEANISPNLPQSPFVKHESPRDPLHSDRHRLTPSTRKRSTSPPPVDYSPKVRRTTQDTTRGRPRADPEREKALDHAPMIRTTTSPRRSSNAQSTQLPPTRPAQSGQPSQSAQSVQPAQLPQPTPSLALRSQPPQPAKPAGPAQSTQSIQSMAPPSGPRARDEPAKAPGPEQAGTEVSELKARIASLEMQLAAAHAKPATPPSPTTGKPPSQLQEDMEGMKKDMATVVNATSTMMESMHEIVDSLNSLQDEVSGLTSQQKQLTALPGLDNLKFDPATTFLQPMQSLAESVQLLREEVSALKQYPLPSPSPTAPTLESLLKSQTSRLDTLAQQLSALQSQVSSLASVATSSSLASRQGSQQPTPQTLRQAMAAAERDLKLHLGTIQGFYHRMDGSRGGPSRAVAERTAELLAVLEDGVRSAGAGMMGVV
ncbi:hypothetical protein VTI74DRAFT_3514 [Chaetomium olivicolor]